MGGSKYISQLLDRYDGDVNLALAHIMQVWGTWLNTVESTLKETQNYVVKVNKFMEENMEVPSIKHRQEVDKNPYESWLSKQGMTFVPTESTYVNETGATSLLDEVFSYNDYLRFLDILLKLSDREDKSKHY